MAKGEISWKGKTDDGERRQVYAHHVGNQWIFFHRSVRFDQWEPLPDPPLEDWLELLDGVERRVARRLLRPEEVYRVKKSIKQRFPEADLK